MWNGLSSRYNQVPFLQDWTGIDVQDVWEMPTPDDDSRWGTSTRAAGVPEREQNVPLGVAPPPDWGVSLRHTLGTARSHVCHQPRWML
jgi:hypothetical protein